MRQTAAVLLALALACRPTCEREVLQSATSPDRRYIANVLIENCHATSPFVTIVTIHRIEDDLDPYDAVFTAKGKLAATATWTSATTMVIYVDAEEVYTKKTRWRDIAIAYAPSGDRR